LAEISGPYDLKRFAGRSYRSKKHPNVASVMNPEIIQHYHAHVYYDPVSSRDRAARLRERVAAAFPDVTLGRWHDAPVGPHTQAMYQLAFPPALLAAFLPWLMLNREGLSILLHPGTGDAYADHTDHAAWLGRALPLRVNVLRKSRKAPAHS
jgi:DOPA 4,5-dioxygenase